MSKIESVPRSDQPARIRKIRIELSKKRVENEFAVCLTKAPELPGKPGSFIQRKFGVNLAVVASNNWPDNEQGWGWCCLLESEKEAIGNKLLEINAKLDEWYFCLMYKGGFYE